MLSDMTKLRKLSYLIFVCFTVLLTGCCSTRKAETLSGPSLKLLTYNVNFGMPAPAEAVKIIRESGADIVCLQETTPQWEQLLRRELGRDYRSMEFRSSQARMGGGLAFLSKVPAREVAYLPSETGWFDGWLLQFDTALGPIQISNVHLRPPYSDGGSWFIGYFSTRGDRLREVQKFYASRKPQVPLLVTGDFNDTRNSRCVRWLERQGLANALDEFDRCGNTWHWQYGILSLSRRIDHVMYPPELKCTSAAVIREGGSDHFPILTEFTRK